MAVDLQLMTSINDLDKEIQAEKSRLKTQKDDYKDSLLQTDEYKAHEEAKSAVKVAKAQLERAILIDGDLNRQRVGIQGQTEKIKDLREILSHHLIKYFEESGRQTIKLDDPLLDSDEVRQIIISAKLGAITLDPENMELPLGRSYEISSSESDKKLVIDKEGMRSEAVR